MSHVPRRRTVGVAILVFSDVAEEGDVGGMVFYLGDGVDEGL